MNNKFSHHYLHQVAALFINFTHKTNDDSETVHQLYYYHDTNTHFNFLFPFYPNLSTTPATNMQSPQQSFPSLSSHYHFHHSLLLPMHSYYCLHRHCQHQMHHSDPPPLCHFLILRHRTLRWFHQIVATFVGIVAFADALCLGCC